MTPEQIEQWARDNYVGLFDGGYARSFDCGHGVRTEALHALIALVRIAALEEAAAVCDAESQRLEAMTLDS